MIKPISTDAESFPHRKLEALNSVSARSPTNTPMMGYYLSNVPLSPAATAYSASSLPSSPDSQKHPYSFDINKSMAMPDISLHFDADARPMASIAEEEATIILDKKYTNESHKDRHNGINALIAVSICLIIGTVTIFISIICFDKDNFLHFKHCHVNNSYTILIMSIGSCFIITSLYQCVSLMCWYGCKYQSVSLWYMFAMISCVVSLCLFIASSITNGAIGEIKFHKYVDIALITYSCLILVTGITIKYLLPKDHFKYLMINLPTGYIHRNAPEFIKKYGSEHPYDRSKLKEYWHALTHQWIWHIIKLGYKKPLQLWDCYDVPKNDHILSQQIVWDAYLESIGFDDEKKNIKFSTFKVMWHLEGRAFIGRCIGYMLATLTTLTVPYIISALSNFYANDSIGIQIGIYLSFILWTVAFLRIEIVSIIFTMTGLFIKKIEKIEKMMFCFSVIKCDCLYFAMYRKDICQMSIIIDLYDLSKSN